MTFIRQETTGTRGEKTAIDRRKTLRGEDVVEIRISEGKKV